MKLKVTVMLSSKGSKNVNEQHKVASYEKIMLVLIYQFVSCVGTKCVLNDNKSVLHVHGEE
jgi:hypothetical protein